MSQPSEFLNRHWTPLFASRLAAITPRRGIGIPSTVLTGGLIGAVAAYQSTAMMLALPPIVLGLVATALHIKVRLWILSPVAVLILAYLVVGIMGPGAASAVATSPVLGGQITLSPFEEQGAYLVFLIAATSAAVGALGYAIARPDGWRRVDRDAIKPVTGSAQGRAVAGILSVVPLGMLVVAYGTTLLVRSVYSNLSTTGIGDPVLIAAGTSALPAVAVLGWLSQACSTRAAKFASLIGVLLYALVLFTLATRAFALLPLMATVGMLAARPALYRLRVALIAAAIGSVFLLQLPLSLRSSSSHGLIPYLGVIAQGLVTIDLQTVFANVLFAFQLTGRVAFGVQALPIRTLLISLNPLPGQASGWYDVQPELRLGLAIPYNTLGELANYGWPVLAVFFVATGAYFGHVDRTVRRLLATGQGLLALLLFGLACLFIIDSLQYNLRNSVRILYYMMALDLAIVFLHWRGARRERRRWPTVPAEPHSGHSSG